MRFDEFTHPQAARVPSRPFGRERVICADDFVAKSAHDILNDAVLLESKALLKQSSLSISEIAYKIGKNDPSDFSRFFKAQTGKTPKEYRE